MSDILADYRIWKSQQEERIGTHSKRCHLWPRHERCMIHRLAAELEKSRKYRDLLEADLSIAMLAATRNGNLSACETVRLTDALAEIERLREAIRRLAEQDATLSVQGGNVTVTVDATLTDAERDAIKVAINDYELNDMDAGCWHIANTLRGLLKRHCPTPENPPPQDNAPETHSNQSEVSVRHECAISPAWMARPFWVDPAAGWSYGFPKLYDPANDGDMTAWLIANGYPRYLADQNLPCTFTAKIDSQ